MQLLISSVCLALTSAVVGNAYYQKKQFYPAVVYITKSNASMAVIYIQFFVIVFMFGKLLRKIFLGTLRAAEFEHLLERFWYALTETCLAFTVFRDDFNPRFVALFTVLLFLKSFHWLAEERVDFMERSPVLGWLFHIRVASLLTVLGILDYVLLMHAYNSTLVRGPTVQLVFGFEYAILLTVIASTTIKYVLHAAEMRTETPWENKAVFLLYTELVIGLLKVLLYVLFVVIMAKIYALPMFVFRPMFFTIRNFKKALNDVIMSRRAIRNMNTLYPDATPEELRLSDNICIICREDMINHSKKLPCGHIFHTTCLRSWFQRQQTCPTCRLNILRTPAVNSAAVPRPDDAAAAGPAAAGVPVPQPGAPHAQPVQINLQQNNATETGGVRIEAGVAAPSPTVGFDILGDTNFPAGTLPNNLPSFGAVPGVGNYPTMPMMPPFMMPPPFSFVAPYAVPPPPMPPDLTTFSDNELRALEGTERQNIEERLKLLRNIQLMLDSAGILMNNYQIIAARMQSDIAIKPTKATTTSPVASSSGVASVSPATVNISGDVGDKPSTSAAAAAVASTFSAPMVAPKLDTSSMTESVVTPQPPQVETIKSSTANISASGTPSKVTIENIGVDDDDLDYNGHVGDAPSSSSIKLSDAERAELDVLRKRRLKFLEERN